MHVQKARQSFLAGAGGPLDQNRCVALGDAGGERHHPCAFLVSHSRAPGRTKQFGDECAGEIDIRRAEFHPRGKAIGSADETRLPLTIVYQYVAAGGVRYLAGEQYVDTAPVARRIGGNGCDIEEGMLKPRLKSGHTSANSVADAKSRHLVLVPIVRKAVPLVPEVPHSRLFDDPELPSNVYDMVNN